MTNARNSASRFFPITALAFALSLLLGGPVLGHAQFQNLYSFCSQGGSTCTDGSSAQYGSLIRDAAGNLYGTTQDGGANVGTGQSGAGGGTVFKLSSSGTYTVLYSFCTAANCADGATPYAGLIEDSSGNFYGTTGFGGAFGGGTVFKLDSNNNETVLYSFCALGNCADGQLPTGSLIEDASGNFYGTTGFGGAYGGGTVFKLDSNNNQTVLYSFCALANCADGQQPVVGSLLRDASGNLYGTTAQGGANLGAGVSNAGGGTIFKLDPLGNETVLYSFCSEAGCTDGYEPFSGLIQDASGNFYGTAVGGGTGLFNAGTVFELDPLGNYTVIYNFCSAANCADGGASFASLIADASGNFFGTAAGGGANFGGTAFQLDAKGNYNVLYNFCAAANCADGASPQAGLVEDAAGNLYGTTPVGGANPGSDGNGAGTIFKLGSQISVTPQSLNFGTVYLNTHHSLTAKLKNLTGSEISLTACTLTQGTADASAYTLLCPTSESPSPWKPGKTRSIAVYLDADAAGLLTATLNVSNTANTTPLQVSLTANVINPVAQFSPHIDRFAPQSVNTPATNTVQLTNTGQTNLNVGNMAIGGAGAANFSETNNCPAVLAPSASCTLQVTFTPTALGPSHATLTLIDNVAVGYTVLGLGGYGK
jgi:uncharacterized repeat protein (TIGR03803 family)